MPANMAVKVLDEFKTLARGEREKNKTELLTQGEMAVLKQVASGIDNKKIAAVLNISEKTVSNRLSEIFSKLQVNNRTQAALLAIRRGWASLYPDEES